MKNFWNVKPFHFNLDTDRDAIPDFRDCRPFDYRKQHISSSIKQRVNNLPVYIISSASHKTTEYPHIRKVPNTQEAQLIYSVMKQFPHLLGDLERLNQITDVRLIFTSFPIENLQGDQTGVTEHYEDGSYGVFVRQPQQIYPQASQFKDDPDSWWFVNKQTRAQIARSIFHELEHIKQEIRDPKFLKKYQAFTEKHVRPTNDEMSAYKMNPYETQAYKESERKVEERYNWPSDEEIDTGFRRIIKKPKKKK